MTATTGFVVQARTASGRLPHKTTCPFVHNKSILQVIIEMLQSHFPDVPLIVATSMSDADKLIVKQATAYDRVRCFCGSEVNVLDRTIQAAQVQGIDHIVRICADNPFLYRDFLAGLMDSDADADYISYAVDNKPAILTHYGLFAERVKKTALQRALEESRDQIYYEHVTNYLYGNPDRFSCHWLNAGNALHGLQGIRLTVDDAEDFKLVKNVYQTIVRSPGNFSLIDLEAYLSHHPEVLDQMRRNTNRHIK